MKPLTKDELRNVCGALIGYEFQLTTLRTPPPRRDLGVSHKTGVQIDIGVPVYKWTKIDVK